MEPSFIRFLADLPAAFGMDNDANAGIAARTRVHVLRQEALMHRTMPLPQDDAGGAQTLRGQPALGIKGSQTTISSSGMPMA